MDESTNTSIENLQWCAGFFEGAGWVSSGRFPSIAAHSAIRDPLFRMEYNFGGSVYYRDDRGKWTWKLNKSDDNFHAAEMMSPFLFEKRSSMIKSGFVVKDVETPNEDWAAGFFEASGSFTVDKRKKEGGGFYYYPRLEFRSTSTEPLIAVCDVLGVGKLYEKGKTKSLVIRQDDAVESVRKFMPLLSQKELRNFFAVTGKCGR